VCVGEIISLPWFSKELKNDLSKNNCLRGVILILLVCESKGQGGQIMRILRRSLMILVIMVLRIRP
jgi:hypothetical protein